MSRPSKPFDPFFDTLPEEELEAFERVITGRANIDDIDFLVSAKKARKSSTDQLPNSPEHSEGVS